mgnify:CR=1 FL=1|jgi:hypothetical protein
MDTRMWMHVRGGDVLFEKGTDGDWSRAFYTARKRVSEVDFFWRECQRVISYWESKKQVMR